MKNRIKELRLSYDLTQKELAEKLNLSKSTITSYELGKRLPNGVGISKLEKFFNVSSDYILGLSDDPNISYIHNDVEIMNTINKNWHVLFSNITSSIKKNDPLTQKLMFNILVELKAVLNSRIMSNHQKAISIRLIHNLVTGLTLSVDRAVNYIDENTFDERRISNYKEDRLNDYKINLEKFFVDFYDEK